MANLTLLEQFSFEILRQLEYKFDQLQLFKGNVKGPFQIMLDEINPSKLGEPEDLYGVAKFLEKNGLNFQLTYDIVNSEPALKKGVSYDPYARSELGIIKEKDVVATKRKISEIKNKLIGSTGNAKSANLTITLLTKENSLAIGDKRVPFESSTLEWALLNLLAKNQTREVYYEEIMADHEQDTNYETKPSDAKRVGDSRSRINRKIIKETDLKEDLIKRRKDSYRFTRKVTKK